MSNAKIYMLRSNKEAHVLTATDYVKEGELQEYLVRYPYLLPGDQIDPETPRRWLLVAREMGVPGDTDETGRWSLDHLFLDQDGIPTFVECKRATDTRARREVVAQMLDYAANGLSYWTLDRLRQDAAETAQQQGSELDLLIQELVDQEDEDVVEQYWSAVERNLKDGRVRLVFVVDKAPRELRRLAEFLNERLADIDVLIVEISQYRSEDHVVLVPRLLGMTEASRLQKQASGTLRKPPLNQEMFLAQLSPVQKQLTEKIWQVAHENGYVIGWRPTAYAVRARQQTSGKERTFLYGYPAGHISIYLETIPLSPQAGAELRSRLLATQLFHESGKHTLPSVAIDATNQAELIKMVKVVCDYVDAALKPL